MVVLQKGKTARKAPERDDPDSRFTGRGGRRERKDDPAGGWAGIREIKRTVAQARLTPQETSPSHQF
ncbi:hypothetical protein GCM10022380_16740 [Amycolatopsis tucumanensis]|uniref:Transposase n=1 Tax=Amycolatopsis tucumanensis TaxID=401106 RepID=A0ABP7HN49_9PSEU